jgi:hypothetical protein
MAAAYAFTKRIFGAPVPMDLIHVKNISGPQQPDRLFKINEPVGPTEKPEQERLLAAGLRYDSNTLAKRLHYSVRPNYKYAISRSVKPLPK